MRPSLASLERRSIMFEIILQIFMMGGAFVAGYCVKAMQPETPKRDKKGRFIKK